MHPDDRVLMGIAVAFTLLAGVGTTCVAFAAEKYGSMAALVPYKPLYQALVVISLAAGIWGIPVTVSLVRGGQKAYRNALLVLLIGAISAGIQMAVSQSVRGASALIVCGTITLTTPLWAGPTHLSPLGGNWVSVLKEPLMVSGSGMLVAGVVLLLATVAQVRRSERWLAVMDRRFVAGP